MKNLAALVLLSLFLTAQSYALVAIDDASAYGSSWSDGDTYGSGFGAWDLTSTNNDGSTNFAGAFIGDSTAGAGDINTGTNQSFGLYANPGSAYIDATRGFASNLAANDRFTFKLALNYANGNKGFELRSGGTQVLGFNVGSETAVINTTYTDTAVVANYDYGGNDAIIDVVIDIINASSLSYQISRSSSAGLQGDLFTGTVTGIAATIDNFKFYINGTDNGEDQNNLYINSLEVTNVPEPAHSVLIFAIIALFLGIYRRRSN